MVGATFKISGTLCRADLRRLRDHVATAW
eukprot:IDg16473t1